MIPCFNELTVGKNGSLPNDVSLCAQAGFHNLELSKRNVLKYLRAGGSIGQLKSELEQNHVTPANLCAVENISFLSKSSMRMLKESAEWTFSACRAIGCGCVEAIASFGVSWVSDKEIETETVQSLLQLSDLAANYGVRLALEFMAVPGSSVRAFGQCAAIIDTVDRSNVGMLLDTWHFYASGAKVEELRQLDGSKVFMLHVSDCPKREPWTAARSESYWPGDGAIPLVQILKTLKQIGYDGMCSLEAMGPEIHAMPAADCIRTAKGRIESVMKDAGVLDARG